MGCWPSSQNLKPPDDRVSPAMLPSLWEVLDRLLADRASASEQMTSWKGTPSPRQGVLLASERSRHTHRPLAQGHTQTPIGICVGRPRNLVLAAETRGSDMLAGDAQ